MNDIVLESTPPTAAWVPRLSPFGDDIAARVRRLQAGVGRSSATTGLLAHLRKSVAKEPGSVPAIWELTVAGLPGRIVDDGPTPQERAAHTALTIYAIHQQSRSQSMHVRGTGFGQAVRRLAGDDPAAAVRRRFDAVATATSYAEAAHHLRSVVTQLRSASIPLDYGQLADDLLMLQTPGGAETVRRRWGRQFYRLDRTTTTASESADVTTEQVEEDA